MTEWKDGKGVWWQTFRSEADALEAAGMREQTASEANVEMVRHEVLEPPAWM